MPYLNSKGKNQGDMKPVVDSYQKPASNYSQQGFNATNEYISRQNSHQSAAASKVKGQGYKGRYS